MKKVAATSGHKVSLAAFFLVLGMTWEGNCAGTEMLLNLYSRPPKRRSPSRATLSKRLCSRAREASWLLKNTRSAPPRNKKMHLGEYFLGSAKRFAESEGSPATGLRWAYAKLRQFDCNYFSLLESSGCVCSAGPQYSFFFRWS